MANTHERQTNGASQVIAASRHLIRHFDLSVFRPHPDEQIGRVSDAPEIKRGSVRDKVVFQSTNAEFQWSREKVKMGTMKRRLAG
jgi:hypothetical protein